MQHNIRSRSKDDICCSKTQRESTTALSKFCCKVLKADRIFCYPQLLTTDKPIGMSQLIWHLVTITTVCAKYFAYYTHVSFVYHYTLKAKIYVKGYQHFLLDWRCRMAKSISIKYHQCVLIFVTGTVCTDSATFFM